MKMVWAIVQELAGMFWADAGLCLGGLLAVALAGAGWAWGYFDELTATAVLVLGTVITLIAAIWRAQRDQPRQRR